MKQFETPDFEVTKLQVLDVITRSDEFWEGDEGPNGTPWN